MKELFVLIAHLLTTLIKLAQPAGVRAVAAESMALKLQLVVVHRTRKRAPSMTVVRENYPTTRFSGLEPG